MSEEMVSVPLEALKAFVAYASGEKASVDAEFVCSRAEQEESDRFFEAKVNALGVPGLLASLYEDDE